MKALLTSSLMLFAFTAHGADITTTRQSVYDWQCQDANGVKVSDHQREGTAIVACANRALADGKTYYVQGGRYRIASTVTAPPPAPTGSAVLSWTAPTQNTDGTPITLALTYRVYRGASPATLVAITTIPERTYTVTGLASGTHYFAVAAVDSTGAESALSGIGSKAVP